MAEKSLFLLYLRNFIITAELSLNMKFSTCMKKMKNINNNKRLITN